MLSSAFTTDDADDRIAKGERRDAAMTERRDSIMSGLKDEGSLVSLTSSSLGSMES